MTRETWNLDYGPLRGLYRDRENGWLFGVCAGIADFLNFRVAAVRLAAVVLLLVFFWPAVIAYIALTFLVKEKPLVYSGRHSEYEFWRRSSYHDRWGS